MPIRQVCERVFHPLGCLPKVDLSPSPKWVGPIEPVQHKYSHACGLVYKSCEVCHVRGGVVSAFERSWVLLIMPRRDVDNCGYAPTPLFWDCSGTALRLWVYGEGALEHVSGRIAVGGTSLIVHEGGFSGCGPISFDATGGLSGSKVASLFGVRLV